MIHFDFGWHCGILGRSLGDFSYALLTSLEHVEKISISLVTPKAQVLLCHDDEDHDDDEKSCLFPTYPIHKSRNKEM